MTRMLLPVLLVAAALTCGVWAVRTRPAEAAADVDAAPVSPPERVERAILPTTPVGSGGLLATTDPLASAPVPPATPTPAPSRAQPQATKGPATVADVRADAAEIRDRFSDGREEMLRLYDADGDGQLSREERQAAREWMRERAQAARDEFIARFDTDGDGELNEAEREAARRYMRSMRSIAAADTDGDGRLSTAEAAAVLERIKAGRRMGDLNGDGVIDAADAAAAMEWLSGQ